MYVHVPCRESRTLLAQAGVHVHSCTLYRLGGAMVTGGINSATIHRSLLSTYLLHNSALD